MVRRKDTKKRTRVKKRAKKRAKKSAKKRTRRMSRNGGMTLNELIKIATERKSGNTVDLSGLEINNERLKVLISRVTFPHMISLHLGNNNIDDIRPLKKLGKKLESLDISNQTPSDNAMSLVPISGLTKLQVLSISNANVVDIAPLRGLTNLKVLWLSGNDIRDYGPISNLELQYAIMSNSTVYDESYTAENDGKTPPRSPHAFDKDMRRQSPHTRQSNILDNVDALAVNLDIDVDGFNQFLSQQDTDDYGGFIEDWDTILNNYDIHLMQ